MNTLHALPHRPCGKHRAAADVQAPASGTGWSAIAASLALTLLAGCAQPPRAPLPPASSVPPVGAASTGFASPGGVHTDDVRAPSAPGAASAPAGSAAAPVPNGGMLVVTDPATLLPVWSEDLRTLSPEALQREVTRLSQILALTAAAPTETVAMSMRLALALTQGRGPGTDWPRAQGLFEQVARSPLPESQPWRPWARLLAVRVQELRRMEEQIDRQSQQLRDQQRRIDTLSDKLEALKAIERNLPARPKAPAAGSSGPSSPRTNERRP